MGALPAEIELALIFGARRRSLRNVAPRTPASKAKPATKDVSDHEREAGAAATGSLTACSAYLTWAWTLSNLSCSRFN